VAKGDSGAISESGGREVVVDDSLCDTAGCCCDWPEDGRKGGVGDGFDKGSWLMTASMLARFTRTGSWRLSMSAISRVSLS
jgi:hypothetical protein